MGSPKRRKFLSMLTRKGASKTEMTVAARGLELVKREERIALIKIKEKKKEAAGKKSQAAAKAFEPFKAKPKKPSKAKKEKKRKETKEIKARLLTSAQIVDIKWKLAIFTEFLEAQPHLHQDIKKQLEVMLERFLKEKFEQGMVMRPEQVFEKFYPSPVKRLRTREQGYFQIWRRYGIDKARRQKLDSVLQNRIDTGVQRYMPPLRELNKKINHRLFLDAMCFVNVHSQFYRINNWGQLFKEALSTYEAALIYRKHLAVKP